MSIKSQITSQSNISQNDEPQGGPMRKIEQINKYCVLTVIYISVPWVIKYD